MCLCNAFVNVMTLCCGIFQVSFAFYIQTQLLAKLEGSFVIFHITPVLFHLAVGQAINFLSKRDITDAWQRDISAAGKKRILA